MSGAAGTLNAHGDKQAIIREHLGHGLLALLAAGRSVVYE
jgi:hypothetical protein